MPARISMLHEADTYKRDCMSSCREIAANRITEIPPGAFETLSSLKELDLRGNSLTNASIASGAFQGLHSLHVLKLDNNEIEDVPVHALRTVTTLVELYVNAKEIQQLGSIVLPG
eukprot:gb/GECG01009152.1/.p1 GENE.gb/GECG01009152.1/~~gb/GECG01009152.1/.p1  ORF type:complete len:115 (+),score=11.47 gb/GECG01009152.1/:1-345(+)